MHELFVSIQQALEAFHQHGFQELGSVSYVLIALLVATEGPATTLVGAAAAAGGVLDIRLVFVATAVGNVAGDALWYSVGYAGKSERLCGLTKRIGLHRQQAQRLEAKMQTHATTAILASKFTFGLIIPTLVAAGLARVPLRRWLPAVLVAETLWTVLLVSIGFHAAGAIARVEDGFRFVGLAAVAVVFTVVLIYLKRWRHSTALSNVRVERRSLLVESAADHERAAARHRSATTLRRPLRCPSASPARAVAHRAPQVMEQA